MIVRERIIESDNTVTIYTYSDRNMMLRSLETGMLYDEAYDPEICGRFYEETEYPINNSENNQEDIQENSQI